jgi:hypothetical protein
MPPLGPGGRRTEPLRQPRRAIGPNPFRELSTLWKPWYAFERTDGVQAGRWAGSARRAAIPGQSFLSDTNFSLPIKWRKPPQIGTPVEKKVAFRSLAPGWQPGRSRSGGVREGGDSAGQPRLAEEANGRARPRRLLTEQADGSASGSVLQDGKIRCAVFEPAAQRIAAATDLRASALRVVPSGSTPAARRRNLRGSAPSRPGT